MTFIDSITCEELFPLDYELEWKLINEELEKEGE